MPIFSFLTYLATNLKDKLTFSNPTKKNQQLIESFKEKKKLLEKKDTENFKKK
jgi:hypothetical protein